MNEKVGLLDNNLEFLLNCEFDGLYYIGDASNNSEKALLMAKDYVDAHPKQAPLITINRWNEWTETSYLEPCTMFGYGYLEAIKKIFLSLYKKFLMKT